MDAEWKKLPRLTVEVEPDLIELIPAFLTRKHADLQTLKNALEKNDLSAVGALGHRIKGEGGGFGFQAMTEIGAALEVAAKKGDRESARQLVADFSEYLEKIEVVESPES